MPKFPRALFGCLWVGQLAALRPITAMPSGGVPVGCWASLVCWRRERARERQRPKGHLRLLRSWRELPKTVPRPLRKSSFDQARHRRASSIASAPQALAAQLEPDAPKETFDWSLQEVANSPLPSGALLLLSFPRSCCGRLGPLRTSKALDPLSAILAPPIQSSEDYIVVWPCSPSQGRARTRGR